MVIHLVLPNRLQECTEYIFRAFLQCIVVWQCLAVETLTMYRQGVFKFKPAPPKNVESNISIGFSAIFLGIYLLSDTKELLGGARHPV